MPLPLIGGALSDAFVWRLTSDVCLSDPYIGPKSRTERPRKTKIGTKVTHVTCDCLDTTFKIKSQRSRSPDRFSQRRVNASGSCSGERVNVLAVGKLLLRCGLLGTARRLGAHGGGEGRDILCRHAHSLFNMDVRPR